MHFRVLVGVSRQQVQELELLNPPSDGVSNAVFGHTSADYLLVSSWDKVNG
jgi:hypothetical protein